VYKLIKKKYVCLLMAVVLLFSLVIAACAGNQPAAPVETTDVETQDTTSASDAGSAIANAAAGDEEEEETAEEGPADEAIVDDSGFRAVTLLWNHIGSPQSGVDRINSAVNEYLASIGKPYSIEMHIEDWGSYTDNTNLRLSTGDRFDICFTANWAAHIYTNAPNGVFTPLNDYIAAYPEVAAILGDGFLLGGQIRGINYGMPTNKELARQYGWVLRADIVEEMGMDISAIETMEDLEPWIIKAYEDHGLWSWNSGINPSFQYDRIEDPIIGMLPFPGSREVILTQLDEHFIEGVRMNNRWFNMGIVNPNLTREISVDAEFPSGRYFANTQQLKPGKAGIELGLPPGPN